MPLYEYSCPKCGQFEVIQNFSDKPLKCKPDCAEKGCPKKAQRLISAAAFHLKGNGWYKTDYASGNSSSSSSSSSGKTSEKSAASSSSSESGGDSSAGSGGDSGKSDDSKKKKSDSKGGKCGSKCGCH